MKCNENLMNSFENTKFIETESQLKRGLVSSSCPRGCPAATATAAATVGAAAAAAAAAAAVGATIIFLAAATVGVAAVGTTLLFLAAATVGVAAVGPDTPGLWCRRRLCLAFAGLNVKLPGKATLPTPLRFHVLCPVALGDRVADETRIAVRDSFVFSTLLAIE